VRKAITTARRDSDGNAGGDGGDEAVEVVPFCLGGDLEARVIDVTHGIAPQAVLQGALVLRRSLPFLPPGIHLAVVDPGVGSERRAIALRTTGGRTFVGPDNGLLLLAADELGVEVAHELTSERHRLPSVSRTFHARDVFAPAAAHLANGVALSELGPAVDPAALVRLTVPEPALGASQVSATVMFVDRFGNVALNLDRAHLAVLGLGPGERAEVRLPHERYYALVADTFADAAQGELILYEDSYGLITLAITGGDASRLSGAGPGDEVRLVRS
jgi:S-adenosylmethionine hydrolase